MFLYCVLVLDNLGCQSRKADLLREMAPDNLLSGLVEV